MSEAEFGLVERLRTVHSMVPSHEALFREAAERITELEELVVDCMESDNNNLTDWDKKARSLGLYPTDRR